jgi:protein tyrosine/serine phosphatase
MRANRSSIRVCVPMVVALSMAVLASAHTKNEKFANIHIQNFGCVNENYYRGAQPNSADYAALAGLGIKTVVDLEREGEAEEQKMVESNGMKFFRIAMDTTSRPEREKVDLFLKIVNDPASQPVFVHCHGGRHRTGVMTAVYRMSHEGWTASQAYDEMKQYEFGKGFGHGALKDYVYDYFAQIESKNGEGRNTAAAGGAKNR